MFPVLLLLGVAVALMRSRDDDDVEVWTPNDLPEPEGPVCVISATPVPEPDSNSVAAWREYFGKKGCVAAPMEMPKDDKDVGVSGDVNQAPLPLAKRIYSALYNQTDPALLLVFGDEVEKLGYQIAANRLRRKAFRLS